jgi:excisionase family DNA binding protein
MYKIVEQVTKVYDAPDVQATDLMRMQDAADYLGISLSYLRDMMSDGTLRTVIDERKQTSARTPRRFVLTEEVEAVKQERQRQQQANA